MRALEGVGAHPVDRERKLITGRSWYERAARLIPEPAAAGRWVDFGCGRGEFLAAVGGGQAQATGLDYWEPNAASVLGEGYSAVVADLNRPLPFRDGTLAGATLIEVIEHILQAETLCAELARVVRPGGWLVLTTPNVAHLRYRWRALTGHPPKQEGYHYRFFTRRTLRELLEECGFQLDGYASYGTSSVLSRVGRLAGRGRQYKRRYQVPTGLESLLATHFVWRLRRVAG
ncbi:MAG: class I SAM-dependent methyltransferase [Planctomycetota bacterium]